MPSTYCTCLWSHTLAIFLDLLFEDNIVGSQAGLGLAPHYQAAAPHCSQLWASSMQSWILIVQPASSRQNICFIFCALQSKLGIPVILIMGGNRLLMTWSREDWGGPWGPWGPWGEETESQAVAIGAHNVPHLDSTLTVRVTFTINTKCAAHLDKVPQWVFHTYPMLCHNMRAECASSICPNWHTLRATNTTVPHHVRHKS